MLGDDAREASLSRLCDSGDALAVLGLTVPLAAGAAAGASERGTIASERGTTVGASSPNLNSSFPGALEGVSGGTLTGEGIVSGYSEPNSERGVMDGIDGIKPAGVEETSRQL